MADAWPDAGELDALYRRLRGGDRPAQADFLAAALDPLVAHLRRWRPDADEHLCVTAAEDTLLDLLREPELYDPGAGKTLAGYLRMSAQCDLLNGLNKEWKHRRNRGDRESVEVAADGRNDPSDRQDDLPSFGDPDLAAEIASFTPAERAVFELMRAGERATAAYVPVLGIGHLPEDRQRLEVKRVKERIFKRLRRAGGRA